ncbi:MAG: hypothetical protein IKC03_00830 [Oscillospiraceae bacterium]|nr:hypothetical protein [Oscillospiraceae bacterium]
MSMKRFLLATSLILLLLTASAVPSNDVSDTAENPESADTTLNNENSVDVEDNISRFEWNETFQTLLDDVNAAHKAVEMYDGDYSAYLGRIEDAEYEEYIANLTAKSRLSGDTVITLEQVTEDMELLYHGLRGGYGAYKYFGGNEVFRPAIDAVIADCATLSTITVNDMLQSMLRHFSFVEDGHFRIEGLTLAEYDIPFFFRDTTYIKTENGYETLDGKIVASVMGQSNLEELFKLSLTAEGDLVYYPVLLKPVSYLTLLRESMIRCSPSTLTVCYQDGSSENLHADPYTFPGYDLENTVVEENDGVPVIHLKNFYGTNGGFEMNSFPRNYRDNDIKIVDLRKCPGGGISTSTTWYVEYTQREFWGNSLYLLKGYPDPMYERHRNDTANEFVPSDTVLIILMSKSSASASEWFIDMGHNLENTLLIGENSNGSYRCTLGGMRLTNTGVYIQYGGHLMLTPNEEYFEEYRGFYPDIWVPAAEAEEAVMNFIAKNTTTETE